MILDTIINPTISADLIEIKKENISQLLGYHRAEKDDIFDQTIIQHITESKKEIYPKACYIILKKEVTELNDELKIGDIIFKTGKIIGSQIRKADYIALFICTIGNRIEKISSNLMKNYEMLDGYIMNLIGSEAAETLADIVHHEIMKICETENLHITNRFSPGYCEWNVEEQFKLFSYFPENICGVSLNESALMNPVKSVSGMVGIGKEVVFNSYKCAVCNDNHCIYRKQKNII